MKINTTKHTSAESKDAPDCRYSIQNNRKLSFDCSVYDGCIRSIKLLQPSGQNYNILVSAPAKSASKKVVSTGAVLNRVSYALPATLQIGGREYEIPQTALTNQKAPNYWKPSLYADNDYASLIFSHHSPSLGVPLYPELHSVVSYKLTNSNDVAISYATRPKRSALLSMGSALVFNIGESLGTGKYKIKIAASGYSTTPTQGGSSGIKNTKHDYNDFKSIVTATEGYYILKQQAKRRFLFGDNKLATTHHACSLTNTLNKLCIDIFTSFPMLQVSIVKKNKSITKGLLLLPFMPHDSKDIVVSRAIATRHYFLMRIHELDI